MCRCFFLVPIFILIIFMNWYFKPVYVQYNTCTISDLVEDLSAMNNIINKMGPYHTYLITTDGRLFVKQRGIWLRLHYKGE